MNNTLKVVLGIIGIIFAISLVTKAVNVLISATIFLVVAYVGYRAVSSMIAKNKES
jgi:hypothetical protein